MKQLDILRDFTAEAENTGELVYCCNRCRTIFSDRDNLADVELERELCPTGCGNDAVSILGETFEEVLEVVEADFELDSDSFSITKSEFGPYLNYEI